MACDFKNSEYKQGERGEILIQCVSAAILGLKANVTLSRLVWVKGLINLSFYFFDIPDVLVFKS